LPQKTEENQKKLQPGLQERYGNLRITILWKSFKLGANEM
jgi:hypothetical protein